MCVTAKCLSKNVFHNLQMLSMENKGMLEEIERLKSAKECLSEELKETFDKLDQLTRGQNVTDVERMTGKLLDEKFTLERRVRISTELFARNWGFTVCVCKYWLIFSQSSYKQGSPVFKNSDKSLNFFF